MTLAEAAGRTYGPVSFPIESSSVAAFVAATGDDPERWAAHAPPSYAAAALFAVAPLLFDDPLVGEIRSLIHTEQSFRWSGPLEVGEVLEVAGTVGSVRSRRSLNLVTFDLRAGSWLEGRSTFLMSAEAAASAEEEPEPPPSLRWEFDPASPASRPWPNGVLPTLRRSASREDLIRYARASGDHNPIHTDHDAAVAAGLPGVIVHGFLMASWLMQAASRHTSGPHPLAEMGLRFRKPLRPAVPVEIGGTASGEDRLNLSLLSGEGQLVSATARVTA